MTESDPHVTVDWNGFLDTIEKGLQDDDLERAHRAAETLSALLDACPDGESDPVALLRYAIFRGDTQAARFIAALLVAQIRDSIDERDYASRRLGLR